MPSSRSAANTAATCNSGLLVGEHRFPARQLRLHEAAEPLGRGVLRDEAHVVETLADVGARERRAELGVQLEDDLARRAGGREHPAPAREVVPRSEEHT